MDSPQDICTTCGNPVEVSAAICPYCGGIERAELAHTDVSTVDVGHAGKTTREAIDALDAGLEAAEAQGIRALVIVHGYGSTGFGGGIRKAVHAACRDWQATGRIRYWLPGERLRASEELAGVLRREVPELVTGPHWNAGNPGITVVRL